jgi:hypothetical protein
MKQINEIEDLSDHYEEDDHIVDLNNEDLVQNIEIMTEQINKELQNNAQ